MINTYLSSKFIEWANTEFGEGNIHYGLDRDGYFIDSITHKMYTVFYKLKGEELKRELMSSLPNPETLWKHNEKSNIYEVIVVSNVKATNPEWPITVVYKDIKTREVWSRPFLQWKDKVKQVFKKDLDLER